MNELKNISASSIKKKQYLLFAAIMTGFIAFTTAVVMVDESNSDRDAVKEKNSEKRIELSKIAGGAKDQDRWLYKAESELKKINQDLASRQTEGEELKSKISELEKVLQAKQEEQGMIDMVMAEMGKLREEVEKLRATDNGKANYQASSAGIDIDGQSVNDNRKIQHFALKLNNDKSASKLQSYDLKHYLPPNSYARAVVIESADASVGVNAQGEPRNMLFRVIGKARGAAHNGAVQETDIVGCMVNGGVAGDLSSERGYIRLVTMNCSRESGRSIITQVKGHVSNIGKAGIRGEVISREGDFIFKSFLAGVAGGAGNGMAQKFTNPMALPSGLATTQPSTQDILSSGLGKGIASSSSSLESYLIKRAEQYQPIISLPVGIEVELVFIEGVYLDGRAEVEEKK